jgi:hypothetical protein
MPPLTKEKNPTRLCRSGACCPLQPCLVPISHALCVPWMLRTPILPLNVSLQLHRLCTCGSIHLVACSPNGFLHDLRKTFLDPRLEWGFPISQTLPLHTQAYQYCVHFCSLWHIKPILMFCSYDCLLWLLSSMDMGYMNMVLGFSSVQQSLANRRWMIRKGGIIRKGGKEQ